MLALIGLGWDTFVSGVKKGADKAGIMPIVQGAVEIVEKSKSSTECPHCCILERYCLSVVHRSIRE
jgi:hypothetical protein